MQVVTVGRSSENNVVVSDDKVSRVHLQIVKDDNGGYSAVDLGSTNGTFVNGRRIAGEVKLSAGDELRIGNTVLPWQNYFGGAAALGSSAGRSGAASGAASGGNGQKPKKKMLYIIIAVVVLLIAGGIVFWKIYSDRQEEKARIQQEQEELDRMTKEANDAYEDFLIKEREAAEKEKEAAEKEKIAAQTKSKADIEAAEKARQEADYANNRKNAADAKMREYKEKMESAQKAMQEAISEADKAKKAQAEAEKKLNNMEQSSQKELQRKDAEINKLNEQLSKNESEAERKKIFDELIDQLMNDAQCKEVGEELGGINKTAIKDKKSLRDKFNKENNKTKGDGDKIISAMKTVVERNSSKVKNIAPAGNTDSGNTGGTTETKSGTATTTTTNTDGSASGETGKVVSSGSAGNSNTGRKSRIGKNNQNQ